MAPMTLVDRGEAADQPHFPGAVRERVLGRLRRLALGPTQSATLVVLGADGRPSAAPESVEDDGMSAGAAGDGGDADAPGDTDVFHLVERERMRIARDIHDGPAQILSNLVLKTEIIERCVASGSSRTAAELEEFRTMARVALDETRRLIFDLRPMSLDDLGLAAALRRLTRQVGETSGAPAAFHVVGEERRIPARVEAMLFRVAQEALSNAARHARATRIDVTLSVAREHVAVTVRDNGEGFDVRAAIQRGRREDRLGLRSMRERAALHDAVVDIVSHPGAGTTVRVSAHA